MEYITLREVKEAVNGNDLVKGSVEKFNLVNTDTRKIEKGSIFIALKGEKFNANEFVLEASLKGAALCIVDEVKFEVNELKEYTSIIVVKDTKKALLELAKYYISTLGIKVVAVTGSTGKTSTKDMTHAVLSEKYKVYKTQGNFNNEIGLPLTIFSLDKTYDIAVLEMGMSDLGEIHNMAEAARPDVALITNVGLSHIENLKTRDNILKAKLEVTDYFNSDSVLVVNSDNDLLSGVKSTDNSYRIIRTGTQPFANIKAKNIVLGQNSISFDIVEGESVVFENFTVNAPGKHNVLNALLAITAGRLFNMDFSEIQSGINKLSMTSMRLDIVKLNNLTIIDDCYNASPDSMRAAIDVLENIDGKRKIAVLGTMRELGEEAYNVHREVGSYVNEKGVDYLIVLGEYSEAYLEGYKEENKFKSLDSLEAINEFLSNFVEADDVILVKASRAMKFEKIVGELKVIGAR